jgi:hypothetical protein
MKHSNIWFASILILSASLLSAAKLANAASQNHPRPHKHKESADEKTQTAKPLQPEPSVPLRDFQAAQSATLDALRALHAEQEARAKDNRPNNEALYANLVSVGLLIVGVVYSFFAWKQWAAIDQQAQIARDGIAKLERPWMFVHLEKLEFIANKAGDYVICVYIRRRNVGRSPAWILGARIATQKVTDFEKLPRMPDYSDGLISLPAPVAQSEELPICEDRFFLDEQEWIDFAKGRLTPVVLGEISYRDNVSPDHHLTRFCICLVHPLKDPYANEPVIITSPIWFFGGPKDYNLFS